MRRIKVVLPREALRRMRSGKAETEDSEKVQR